MRAVWLISFVLLAAPVDAQANPQAGDEEAGREYYTAECKVCHGGMIAPTLRGVIGRPIASIADFGGYSPALKAKAGAPWTEAALDAFLKAPAEFAPGTLMVKAVPENQTRADVIAYLKTLAPVAQ